jgi:hypothetical protein
LDDLIGGSFWARTENSAGVESEDFGAALDVNPDNASEFLPDYFDSLSSHLCTFVNPQIALTSDIDEKSTIILAASLAEVKAFQVVDLRLPEDPINREVLTQTYGKLDKLQAFYPSKGSESRSIFVPLETHMELGSDAWDFVRVVPHTSASLRYDKFNQLRMSSKGGVTEDLMKAGSRDNHFSTGTDRGKLLKRCAFSSAHICSGYPFF